MFIKNRNRETKTALLELIKQNTKLYKTNYKSLIIFIQFEYVVKRKRI